MMKRNLLFSFLLLLPCFCLAANSKVSLVEMGLLKAKSGTERYEILLSAHQKAVVLGTDVDYSGIKQIDLEIPQKAQSIPLTTNNDFCNAVFNVKNCSIDFVLFQTNYKLIPIEVSGKMIKCGRYPVLKKISTQHPVLLIIEDQEPWVQKRDGNNYSYGVMRKEALLVKRGRAVFSTTTDYDDNSIVKAYYRVVDDEGTTFCNLVLNRTNSSTKKTFLFKIENENCVNITNVIVNTPSSELTGDVLMAVNNSTNVNFADVAINNTYSSETFFGYGINMNNVTNAHFARFCGYGKWGVFGTYSVNTAFLEECDLNRFDIHCYGRDVTCERCSFRDLYNQFSSFYGSLYYKSCTFNDFIPVSIEMSFNAYTGFDIFFEDCIISTTSRSHELISVGRLDNQISPRMQLKEKCWPNLTIKNLTVHAEHGANPLYIYRVRGDITYPVPVGYLSSISVDGLTYHLSENAYPIKDIYLCSTKIQVSNNLNISLKDIDLSIDDNKKGSIVIMIQSARNKDKVKTQRLKSYIHKANL